MRLNLLLACLCVMLLTYAVALTLVPQLRIPTMIVGFAYFLSAAKE